MKKSLRGSIVTLLTKSHFSKLWASQILTQVGLNLLNFIIVIRIFEKTHSSFAVSLVWLFYALPAIILGPFTGTLIDVFSRRKVLITANLFQAMVILLYLLVKDSIWPIYAVIFIYSLFLQLYIPAEAATLPLLVKKHLLPIANSLFLFTIYLSFLVGFGLAGPVIEAVGRRTPFLLVSGMLLVAATVVFFLPKDGNHQGKITTPTEFWKKFQEGYEFMRKKPAVLLPLGLLVLSGIIIPIVGITAPAIAVDLLGISLLSTSTRIMVPIGIGAILGAFITVRFLKNVRKKRIISAGLFVAALGLLFIATILPVLPNRAVLGSVAAFLLGISLAMSVIPAQTLLQEQTPEEFRGRVFGTLNFLITIASFLPILSISAFTELLGERLILAVLAIALFLTGVASLNFEYLVRRLYAKTI